MNYLLRRAWWFAALWLLAAAAAHAHDASQSSTDIWLRPEGMEVDLTLSRVPSRSLADNPPPIPVTVDNFEARYHALLRKSADSLFAITLDGQPWPPTSVDVALSGETDLQFTLIYPRPAGGQFSITAAFIKRMEPGYVNVLSLNEGQKVLGTHIQKAADLTWKFDLSPPSNPASPNIPPAVSSASAHAPAAQPAKTASPDDRMIVLHLDPVLLTGLLVVIILLAIWLFRQKS